MQPTAPQPVTGNEPQIKPNWIHMVAATETLARARYVAFVESMHGLPWLERAEAWLSRIAANELDSEGAEAAIYLASRGVDVSHAFSDLRKNWIQNARSAVEEHSKVTSCLNADNGETTCVRRLSEADSADIERHTLFDVPNFWDETDRQQFSGDATALRAAEWGHIRGFAPWWRRLNRYHYGSMLLDPQEPGLLIGWLFNMSRSPMARVVMKDALTRAMEVVEFAQFGKLNPWTEEVQVMNGTFRPEWHVADDIIYAAALIFCIYQLQHRCAHKLIPAAVACLRSYQREDGSWPSRSDRDSGSILATAIALHALAAIKLRNKKKIMCAGIDWLLTQQAESGCWSDDASYLDPTYTTVLVLDAISAAQGKSNLTYTGPPAAKTVRTIKQAAIRHKK